MSFYNPAPKEAILYYAQVMAGSWGYKPVVYAKRMGWLDSDEKVLKEKIKKFRSDELHHRDVAYEHGASKKGLYSILDKVIKTGSKVAISISEKI